MSSESEPGAVESRLDEEVALQQFHDAVVKAYRECMVGGPSGKSLSNFFFGQKLRRLVREALREYGDIE